MITDLRNGKLYIGESVNLEDRLSSHRNSVTKLRAKSYDSLPRITNTSTNDKSEKSLNRYIKGMIAAMEYSEEFGLKLPNHKDIVRDIGEEGYDITAIAKYID